MKNLHFLFLAALAATLVGCGNSTPKPSLSSEVDTLSYALGITGTRGLQDYLYTREGIDTSSVYMEAFLKGVKAGVNASDDKKKAAFYAGVNIGQQIANQMVPNINRQLFDDDTTRTISVKNYLSGFISEVRHQRTRLQPDLAMAIVQTKMEEIRTATMRERFAPNLEAGKRFLEENAKKEGVVTLPSGLQYKVIKQGHGPIPADSCTVEVNYEGRLINDTIFDSSYQRGKPAQFRLRGVIPGWTEAITQMPVGSEWEIYVPQELAYGERRQAKIDPFSALVFKIELLDIVDKNKK